MTELVAKDEWDKLSLAELYQQKSAMLNRYYTFKDVGASYADQYLAFISELELKIDKLEQPSKLW